MTSLEIENGEKVCKCAEYLMRPANAKDLDELYRETEKEGLLETVFYDVYSGGERMDSSGFQSRFKAVEIFGLYSRKNYPLGYVWVTEMKSHAVQTHFCFFPSRIKDTVALAKFGATALCLFANSIKGVPDIKTFYGYIPEFNQRAIDFTKKLGWKESGRIPNFVQNKVQDLVLLTYKV